jgi:type IV pilus assembly protein PilY1
MNVRRLIFSIFVSVLVGLSGSQQALADDADIYTLPPKFTTDAAPKVLIIFDTSGSMDNDVTSRPAYDPTHDYITDLKALDAATANDGVDYTGSSITADRVYWARPRWSGGAYNLPDHDSSHWFDKASLNCLAAMNDLYAADSDGFYGDDVSTNLIAQHNTSGDDRWGSLRDVSSNSHVVDCKADEDPDTGEQTDTNNWLHGGSDADGYFNNDNFPYTWTNARNYRVRLYTANYIAYWQNPNLPTTRARLRVAKVAMKAAIDGNPTVHFGLMAFNQNNSTPHGGRIVQAIGDPDEEITYSDTTLNTAASSSDTDIYLANPSRFAVGDKIGIEINGGGGIHWTTVAANVHTTLAADLGTASSTATVTDASGFTATDAVGIKKKDGYIEWETVSSISGNDLTLGGTISKEAYAEQPVYGRKITLTDPMPGTASAGNTVYGRSTRRDALKDKVESLIADGSTPLSESLYEAYRYFAGKTVVYGNPGGSPNPATDICAQDPTNCTTTGTYSSPLKYECEKAYIVMMTDGAPTSDTDEQQYLTTTNFPAVGGTDKQAIVLGYKDIGWTDGDGTSSNWVTTSTSTNGSGLPPLARWMNKNDVVPGLAQTQNAKFYAVTFGSGITATAKNLLDRATQEGTGNPNKEAIQADDVNELQSAFDVILGDIKIETASFGAPTLSVNAFNKLYNRDEVYFALFEPGNTARWNGNLKKFRLCNSADATNYGCEFGEIIDATNAGAIDNTTKRIKVAAQSYWSSGTDGGTVTDGGAGEVTGAIDPDTNRRLYTWRGTYSGATYPLTLEQVDDTSGGLFDAADPSATPLGNPAILGLAGTATTADVTSLIGWMMGKDAYNEDGDASTTNRWSVADPLHSRPVAITYGAHGGDYNQPVVKLVMAGNDGAIRMFNDANGKEEWAFVPQEMFEYQAGLANPGENHHVYGVDNTVTVWVQDNNNNGKIEPGTTTDPANPLDDKVYLYASMRRGPVNDPTNYIYALDVTPASEITDKTDTSGITPKLLWVIEGGIGDYLQLGQTWSVPQVATIRVKTGGTSSEERTALIFGGGYDRAVENQGAYPAVDNKVVTKNNTGARGNAIFIADATDGSRIWWASNATATDGNGDNADLQLSDMIYPIPSDLALLDSNGDEAIDRIYVGDVGGQVWRIDLSSLIDPSGASPSARNGGTYPSKGYVFADLVCDRATTAPFARNCPATDDPQEWRRVFYAPDVAAVTDNVYVNGGEPERQYDMVFVATGDRPDPLDRLTSLGLANPEQPVHNAVYGLKEPNYAYGTVASPPRPITPHGATSDVHDATANLIETGTAAQKTTAANELRDRKGWMVYFKEATAPSWTTDPTDPIFQNEGTGREFIGEKSLARPVIFGGVVYVTTFTPPNAGMTSALCEPNEGLGRVYGLNYLDAKIAIDLDGDGSRERSIDLGGGIPSELVTVIREDGTTGLVGSSGGAAKVEVEDVAGQERTFWYQE